MRLINTKTFLLESIYVQVPYAILSHTWGPEEISFQEWEVVHDSGAIQGQCPHTQKMSRPNITRKKGYEKVIGACQQAARDGIQYLWCDTNCIDKTSSAELSEAINSMFAWYRDSKICYVILADVQVPTNTSLRGHKSNTEGWFTRQQRNKRQNIDVWERFQTSRWWTRGWTLQELLAPKHLIFFARDWSPLGNKIDLSEWILRFTTIHHKALQDASCIPTFSIAQRMSWAADRRTTVPEDMAYCLLGIFDINMPMLYGQGHKAFLKLQEEIIKVSDDQSILAWENTDLTIGSTAGLAASPSAFRKCGDISRCIYSTQASYSITNLGISIKLEIMKTDIRDVVLAGLNCCRVLYHPQEQTARKEFRIWIPLLITGNSGDNRWLRAHASFSWTCLEHQYQSMGTAVSRELFIATEFRSKPAPVSNELQVIHKHRCPESSGFLLELGFGDIDHIQAYLKTYNVRHFTTTSLRQRRTLDMSHELVCSGHFSILLSAVWDRNGANVASRYIVLQAKASSVLTYSRDGEAWSDLLNQPNQEAQSIEKILSKISKLHKHLERCFPPSSGYDAKLWPLVQILDNSYYDFRGRPEVFVEIIFRDLSSR